MTNTPDVAMVRALLERVATDNNYREQLISNPLETLTDAGFAVSQADVPYTVSLPSNAEILAALDDLPAQIAAVHWYKLGE